VFTGEAVNERDRPDWLLNITDDAWFGDSAGPRQHFAAARLRAVEEGLPVARAANSGISAMIGPFGNVTASLPLDGQGVLVSALPGPLPPTIYSRLGLGLPALLGIMAIITGALISMRA
jgi:apolipoprotein N-acyltransferase